MPNFYKNILSEVHQDQSTRIPLFEGIQEIFEGRVLVTYFTSFRYPVEISDEDCDMLQNVLQGIDCSKGLVLMIDSPGGNGLVAERIVNICRAYSGTHDYWALVAGKAKSAATIISMGASKIIMSNASELGPVDPQIIMEENGSYKFFSAHNLVSGYERLFSEAKTASGPIEPYLQQLANYDDREITKYRSIIELADDISVKILKSGMLKNFSKNEIKKKIEIFLKPSAGTIAHSRPIYYDEVVACGLNVQNIDIDSKDWKLIYQLYCRTNWYVSNVVQKNIEAIGGSFCVGN